MFVLVIELWHGSAWAMKYAHDDWTFAHFSSLIDQVRKMSWGIFLWQFYRYRREPLTEKWIVLEDSRAHGALHQPWLHLIWRELITSDLIPEFSWRVDSIIMRNVLSCPIFFRWEKNWSHDFWDAESTEDDTLIEHIDQLLIPWWSLLSIETYTPEYAGVQYERLRNRWWKNEILGEYHQTWTKPSGNRTNSNLWHSH